MLGQSVPVAKLSREVAIFGAEHSLTAFILYGEDVPDATVAQLEEAGQRSTRDEDVAAARKKFGDFVTVAEIRAARKKIAPPGSRRSIVGFLRNEVCPTMRFTFGINSWMSQR